MHACATKHSAHNMSTHSQPCTRIYISAAPEVDPTGETRPKPPPLLETACRALQHARAAAVLQHFRADRPNTQRLCPCHTVEAGPWWC